MEPPQVVSLGQATQASLLSQAAGGGILDTRLCDSQAVSTVTDTDGGDYKPQQQQTESSALTQHGDGIRRVGEGGLGGLNKSTPQPIVPPPTAPGNGKSAHSDVDGDETDGYLQHRGSPGVPVLQQPQQQHNSSQAKEDGTLMGLDCGSTVQKTVTSPVALDHPPLQTSVAPPHHHFPTHTLKTMSSESTVAALPSELNQHETSSELLDAAASTLKSPTNVVTTRETNISLAVDDVVGQVLQQNVPLCQQQDGSGKSKVLVGYGDHDGTTTCTETILAVTETGDTIQAVVTESGEVILNDGLMTVSQVQVLTLPADHQPQANSISIVNSEASVAECESLVEVLQQQPTQLLSTSQIDSELLTQHLAVSVPSGDHHDAFSEMEVSCTNASVAEEEEEEQGGHGSIMETQTTEIHTHVLRDLGQVCFLQTDLVSDLASLPVEILEQEVVEEGTTWLVGDDGQVMECSEAHQLMDVTTVTDETHHHHCLETQTIEVSECTVVTYPSEAAAILSHVHHLHLPEGLQVTTQEEAEAALGATSSMALLTEEDLGTGAVGDLDADTQSTASAHCGVTGTLKPDLDTVGAVSYVDASSGLTSTAALDVGVQGVCDDTEVSPSQEPPSAPGAGAGAINPKLLILKRGETPLLKSPPDLLAGVAKRPSPMSMSTSNGNPATGASSSSSSTTTSSLECLSPSTPAAVSVTAPAESTPTRTSIVFQPTSVPGRLTFTDEDEETSTAAETLPSALHTTPDGTESPPSSPSTESPEGVTRRAEARRPLVGGWSEVCSAIGAKRETGGLKRPGDEMGQGDGPLPLSHTTPSRLDTTEGGDDDDGESSDGDRDGDGDGDADADADADADGDGDGEADISMDSHADTSITTPTLPQRKVRQWISGRLTAASTPSTSPSPSPGPSILGDHHWTPTQLDRSSPLRGSHGKFISPPHHSRGGGGDGSGPSSDQTPTRGPHKHADMAELAKHEAEIEHRTLALKREGHWSLKRLNRLTEPIRPKVHWDYLCEEMQWLAADFAQERRWKRGVARKVVRMVMRYHEEIRQKEERAKREEQAKLRRVASSIAKEVRAFWTNVEKVVQYKQQSRLDEKRKKALDLQLDFIVGQTERYSDLLSQSLSAAPTATTETPASPPPEKSTQGAADEDDHDFEPPCEEEDDDEDTIEKEEQQEGNDAETRRREIELLRQEGMLPLDQLLNTITLPPPNASEDGSDSSSSVEEDPDEDEEFTANEEDAADEEETIEAQEAIEGDANHEEELDDLAKEGEMSVAQLLEKYKGAYTSDFEEPSGSASAVTSEEEASTEEEEDEDETDGEGSETNGSSDSSEAVNSDDDVMEDEDEDVADDDDEEEDDGEGMEALLREGDHSPPLPTSPRPKKDMSHIAATAESLQPKGYTLATTKVKTPIPFLLHGNLREYQHIGLDWLVTMYEKKLNGILADEMGLGKTIQTIALLAHLACEKANWGPHLIIVPTSVMLNWEMELKRWCPGFKILTYYGSQKERKLKRQGWTKPNAFHVCITSYKLVLQDHQAFRRKSWRYLILDEAQNIKNFKSQRWQSLLNFNSHRRLLLTGTPLQNSLMELWSLMHFLMPHVFQSHREFKEWFSNPLTGMIEGSQEYNEGLVKRLHKVLRPFLLRRVKVDVEKQMPKKYEHVVRCRLSKRQRFLYDDFMAQASTRETLASGHFMSVINILMQLRKVCNHPNLFDPRPIHSPFITKPVIFSTASIAQQALDVSSFQRCDLSMFDLVGLEGRLSRYEADIFLPRRKVTTPLIQEIMDSPEPAPRPKPVRMKVNRMFQPMPKSESRASATPANTRPTCSVAPVVQPPRSALITEVTPTPAPIPLQPPAQVCAVMPVSTTAVASAPATIAVNPVPAPVAVRPPVPHTVLSIRAPTPVAAPVVTAASSVLTQRVLLSPDMQARLPSGEVVSIAQLASLAGRPVPTGQGSKPVTFQLQGNKLTLSGTQLHQVPVPQPRPLQGNVMHLVSSGGQHHLISQPAQVALIHTVSQAAAAAAAGGSAAAAHLSPGQQGPAAASSGLAVPLHAAQAVPSNITGSGIVKIVVRQAGAPTAGGKEASAGPVPALAVPPSPRVPPPVTLSLHPHPSSAATATATATVTARIPTLAPQRPTAPQPTHYAAPPRTPAAQPPLRPVLRVLQGPPAPTPAPAPAPAPQTPAAAPAPEPVRVNATTTAAPREESSSSSRSRSSESVTVQPDPPVSKSGTQPGGFSFQRPRPQPPPPPRSPFSMPSLEDRRRAQRDARLARIIRANDIHCDAKPVYGREVLNFLTFLPGAAPRPASKPAAGLWRRSGYASCLVAQSQQSEDLWAQTEALRAAIQNTEERLAGLAEIIDRFTFVIPPVEAPPITMHSCHPPPSLVHSQALFRTMLTNHTAPLLRPLHRIQCNMRTHFPDLRLIQYDCGKLQTMHLLLRKLKAGSHRVLIFTQMTRMLDVLEQFLNYHGHIYLRLDGSTRVEQRQSLMERFNADRRIFCFILSTRSGGVGVNLTGADTVVFYDSDWNPTMDAQAQDRCHRIGQTRDVHIYRLISERTVEENILKKANQKRMLGDMAIDGGNFTTAFFKEQTIKELFDVDGEKKEPEVVAQPPAAPEEEEREEGANKQHTTILEQALCRAEDEEDIVAASQAKAEQVAELAEFNESIPLDDGGEGREEEEELSKAEQEIAALVEQLTPIERYAMNFLEASLEDVCKEELKQAEEQVEAARKGLDQAKEEGLKLHQSSDNEEEDEVYSPMPHSPDEASFSQTTPSSARRTRKHKEKGAPSTRVSGRLRGTPVKMDDDPAPTPSPAASTSTADHDRNIRGNASSSSSTSALTPQQSRQVPDRRGAPRGRPSTKEATVAPTPTPTTPAPKAETLKTQAQSAGVSTRHTDSTGPASPLREAPPSNSKPSAAAPSPLRHSLSPNTVPSAAGSSAAGRSQTSEHAPLPAREHPEETRKGDAESSSASTSQVVDQPPMPAVRERGVSVSSGSICSPEHQSDLDSRDLDQHSHHSLPLSPGTASRSPRKRQSADGEVLKGLPEDSPSAKVLRKLPGRLVTVVEEKEQQQRKRRRRRGSGGAGHTEGSSEETEHTESEKDTGGPSHPGKSSQKSRDKDSQDKETREKDTPKSPTESRPPAQLQKQEKEPVSPTSPLGSPIKGYHPYSPAHHSPDMPVLRNLPVRRRLETESRMAAQLSEQLGVVGRGRGLDRRKSLSPKPPKKMDLGPSKDCNVPSGTPNADNAPPVKRRPGRPPKRPVPPVTPPPAKPVTTPDKPAPSAKPAAVEKDKDKDKDMDDILSPKRKRGRPRKTYSTIKPEALKVTADPPTTQSPANPSNPAPPSIPQSTACGRSSPRSPLATLQETPSDSTPANSSLPSLPAKAADTNSLPKADRETSNTPVLSPTAPPASQSLTMETAKATTTLAQTPKPSEPQKNTNTIPTPAPVPPQPTASKPPCQTTLTPSAAQPTTASDPKTTTTATPAQPKPSTVHTQPSSPSPPSSLQVDLKTNAARETSTTLEVPQTLLSSSSSSIQKPATSTTLQDLPPTSRDSEKKPPSETTKPPSEMTTSEPTHLPVNATPEPKSPVQVKSSSSSSSSPPELQTSGMCPTPTPAEPEPPPASEPSEQHASPQPALKSDQREQDTQTTEVLTEEKTPGVEEVEKEEEATKVDIREAQEKDSAKEMATEEPPLAPQSKRRRVEEDSPERREPVSADVPQTKTDLSLPNEETTNQSESREESKRDEADGTNFSSSSKKRALSRQSSQDSVRSSSPSSSVSSGGTRSSRTRRTAEEKNQAGKRKRGEAKTGTGSKQEGNEEKKAKIQKRRSKSPSSSSSSSSDSEESRAEKRLTRAERKKKEKESQSESDEKKATPGKRGRRSKKEESASNATTASNESGSETSARVTRKSSGPAASKPKSGNTTATPVPSTPPPPQPEVLGKRCSALNAAAKLVAMRGTPTSRPKPPSTPPTTDSPSAKLKSKAAGAQASPQTNSSVGRGGGSGRQTPTNTPFGSPESGRSASSLRSTRQRPGSLVAPLDAKNKQTPRSDKKKAERETEKKEGREDGGEEDNRESRSSRGHSACSSFSSERGADGGSSRSRSSSNSSQRTPSLSSQSTTEPQRPRSRATSSGSDTEQRSGGGGKQSHSHSHSHRHRSGGEERRRGRRSHRETRSNADTDKDKAELSGGSAEGTPDRVLRSVAAMAAVHARSPACNTRSSQRPSKT